MASEVEWTHPSVIALMEEAQTDDPLEAIAHRARDAALDAIDGGWEGPPFDPFDLAAKLGLEAIPRENLDDARLVATGQGEARIEFNPVRRPARIRFSVAHEIGHYLFSDHDAQTRYRRESHSDGGRADDWQLEVLCNVAAAEILMPAGAFPISEADDLQLARLLDLRKVFRVSTEALIRRVMRLTGRAACMVACARQSDGQFRVDYTVPSRAWEGELRAGQFTEPTTAMAHCTAVGFSVDDVEHWPGVDGLVRLQAVGIPPYPGEMFPRVLGLLTPEHEPASLAAGVRMVRGDATQPQYSGPAMIAHIVNDRARSWGPVGFAPALARRFSAARDAYTTWSTESANRELGAVHFFQAADDLWIASMVSQVGFGDRTDGQSRLRLPALAECLSRVGDFAEDHWASVHMPPIGTGQGATPWPVTRDLILELLVDRRIAVTVYVLDGQPMPVEELPSPRQLALI